MIGIVFVSIAVCAMLAESLGVNEKTHGVTEVFCTFKMQESYKWGKLNTCFVNQNIDREDYVLGDKLDTTVKQFGIGENKKVKFLPRHIGEKLPNLKEFWANKCGLKDVRNHYFKDMGNLQHLALSDNEITTIEPDSFKDLISVEHLWLYGNMIETLDEKLFTTMINLQFIFLDHNRIKFLSPATFKIPGGKLGRIDLSENVCIDGYHKLEKFDELTAQIIANCTR